uniref:Uncharacterized protein n=1 Tax=Haemonchus contortus TaxID=6289 RepID=A0A7I5EB98_HAECO
MEFQGGDTTKENVNKESMEAGHRGGNPALSFSLEGKALERKQLLRRYRKHDLSVSSVCYQVGRSGDRGERQRGVDGGSPLKMAAQGFLPLWERSPGHHGHFLQDLSLVFYYVV